MWLIFTISMIFCDFLDLCALFLFFHNSFCDCKYFFVFLQVFSDVPRCLCLIRDFPCFCDFSSSVIFSRFYVLGLLGSGQNCDSSIAFVLECQL